MKADDERRIRKNWSFLKQELVVEDFVQRYVDLGLISEAKRDDILYVMPNTKSMKGEKFLQVVLASGDRGYQLLCSMLRDNADNRYSRVIDRLEIIDMLQDSRPSTGLSSTSSTVSSMDGETGERNVRRKKPISNDETGYSYDSSGVAVAAVAPVATVMPERHNHATNASVAYRRQSGGGETGVSQANVTSASQMYSTPAQRTSTNMATQQSPQTQQPQALPAETQPSAAADNRVSPRATTSIENTEPIQGNIGTSNVDMRTLEQELVRMAPAIAELFQKITKQTSSLPTSEEDIQKVKEENERLRKTNKSLIEKLNNFQQKIIQLQLENKKLKEHGDTEKIRKAELQQKAKELQDMERRLEEHKVALEEKEQELNLQLSKLKEIEEENAVQKEKIDKLEELQDEGILERNLQQEQISDLVEVKEQQRDQIDNLEEKQKMGEQRMYRLEERLMMLEQRGRQSRRGTRIVSPPRSNWMTGNFDRSHHASIKYNRNSEIKFQPEGKTSANSRKGWPFT